MPYTYVHFYFNFVDQKGKAKGFVPRSGKIDEEGIALDGHDIRFRDIADIKAHQDHIAFEFYPYTTLDGELSKHIIQPTSALVVVIDDNMGKDVKQLAIQYFTTFLAHQRKHDLEQQGKKDDFKAEQCPTCAAVLDLSYYADTHYIYCKHCETIFDKLKQPIPNSDNYSICPETGFYDRVQHYTEFSCYALPKNKRFGIKKHECGDAFAELLLEQIFWRNALFLVALPAMFIMRSKATESRSPLYAELPKANKLALVGKLQPALDLYMLMNMRMEKHPALWLNQGLAFLLAGENEKALQLFRRALSYCSNYKPVLDVMRKYGELEIVIG
jgi:hypothetical protein